MVKIWLDLTEILWDIRNRLVWQKGGKGREGEEPYSFAKVLFRNAYLKICYNINKSLDPYLPQEGRCCMGPEFTNKMSKEKNYSKIDKNGKPYILEHTSVAYAAPMLQIDMHLIWQWISNYSIFAFYASFMEGVCLAQNFSHFNDVKVLYS